MLRSAAFVIGSCCRQRRFLLARALRYRKRTTRRRLVKTAKARSERTGSGSCFRGSEVSGKARRSGNLAWRHWRLLGLIWAIGCSVPAIGKASGRSRTWPIRARDGSREYRRHEPVVAAHPVRRSEGFGADQGCGRAVIQWRAQRGQLADVAAGHLTRPNRHRASRSRA